MTYLYTLASVFYLRIDFIDSCMKINTAVSLCIGILLSLNIGCGYSQSTQPDDSLLLTRVLSTVQSNHLMPKAVDANLSEQIFNGFLQALDAEKSIFTMEDIHALGEYRYLIGEEFAAGTSGFFDAAISRYETTVKEMEAFYKEELERKMDIHQAGVLESDLQKRDYAFDRMALQERWRLLLTQQFIQELLRVEQIHPDLQSAAQEEMAKERMKRDVNRYFSESLPHSREALIEEYVNAYVQLNDYQSQYLSVESKQTWDAQFNRNFVGVGVSIETTLDYPIVKEVLFNGPVWKSKQVRAGDKLIAIAQGEQDFVDLAGMSLTEVLDLLKGEKDSAVRIQVRHPDSKIEDVMIAREQITLELASSHILSHVQSEKKVGYLRLPRFYQGEAGCAAHILSQLNSLNTQNVEGIIFDLRNNQGGSAREAVMIMGYFLEGGTVMQARYTEGRERQLQDRDPEMQYDGKLIVLVNERSGSASELTAGTMQDYGRAIVVGSQTYGKGSIQRFFGLTESTDSIQLGEIKLTIGAFYTAAGRSTQFNGIQPDIVLPSPSMHIETGERGIAHALTFEDLPIADSKIEQATLPALDEIRRRSEARVLGNPHYAHITQAAVERKAKRDNSLIEINYTEMKALAEQSQALVDRSKRIQGFRADVQVVDETTKEVREHWRTKLEADHDLHECFWMMRDWMDS